MRISPLWCGSVHLCGKSFPRRCASLLQIIERWLSIIGWFEGHQLLEAVGAALCYQLAFPVCAWCRVSRALQSGSAGGASALREQGWPRWGQRGPPSVSKVASSHEGTHSNFQRQRGQSTGLIAPQFSRLRSCTKQCTACAHVAVLTVKRDSRQPIIDHWIKESL